MKQHDASEQSRYKVFTRRAAILGGVQGALLLTLVGRLYYLQIIEGDRYRRQADDNRINLRLLPPPRGSIVDRFGRPLAANRKNYRLVVTREEMDNPRETLERLAQVLPINEREKQKILRDMQRKRSFIPVTVRENLTWEHVTQIEVNSLDLPGAAIEEGITRFYPHGEDVAHLLGYVGAVSEAELDRSEDPLLQLPGFRIGKSGVERIYDLPLRGQAGSSQVEVNALGRVIRELDRDEGTRGREVRLAVDLDLQRFTMQRLAAERSAACVVMDPFKGDVLVLASVPSYDPNGFARGLGAKEWQTMVSNPLAPLTNKPINGLYHPGSVFKMVVALAIQEAGVTATEKVFCPGHLDLGEDRFHCWKQGGHGSMALHDALVQSCDVYFYEMSLRAGVDRIAAMARRFTLGEKTGIDLPGETEGSIPSRDWKLQTIGKPWTRGETLVASIGQGYILTTPVQLCVMTARLINGGRAVEPHLAAMVYGDDGKTEPRPYADWPSLGLREEHLKLVRAAMEGVVLNQRGTAYAARITQPGLSFGGKTGTAQVRRITMAERERGVRKNEDLPWEERDHALFVGFGPTEQPRYAISVVVEHGGSGGQIAAPIARDVMTEVLKKDPLRGPIG